jgi:hypothetical protein
MNKQLTSRQRLRLVRQLQALLTQGQGLHVGVLGHQPPDWMKTKWVLGTPEDMTLTRITRACVGCGQDVSTSTRCPDDVPLVCEVCLFDELVQKEAAAA